MNDMITNYLPEWATHQHFILPTWQWLAVAFAFVLGFFFKNTSKFFLRLFIKVTDRDGFRWQNRTFKVLERPAGLIIACVFWYACLGILQIEGTTYTILKNLVQITLSAALIWATYNLTDVIIDFLSLWADKTENSLDDHLVPLAGKTLKLFVVVFGALVSIQNLGFNVMSVLAGLGLGGLAFALAAKDTCANLFGSIMILLDRPFVIGDWIVAGEMKETSKRSDFAQLVCAPSITPSFLFPMPIWQI